MFCTVISSQQRFETQKDSQRLREIREERFSTITLQNVQREEKLERIKIKKVLRDSEITRTIRKDSERCIKIQNVLKSERFEDSKIFREIRKDRF